MLRGLRPSLGFFPIFINVQAISFLPVQAQATELDGSTVHGMISWQNHSLLLLL
jgi:hypothetical protein